MQELFSPLACISLTLGTIFFNFDVHEFNQLVIAQLPVNYSKSKVSINMNP